jgi:hypothetical protein
VSWVSYIWVRVPDERVRVTNIMDGVKEKSFGQQPPVMNNLQCVDQKREGRMISRIIM